MIDGVTSVQSARRQALRGEIKSIYAKYGSDTDQADDELLARPRCLQSRCEGHAEYACESDGESRLVPGQDGAGQVECEGADAISSESSFRVLAWESAELRQVAMSISVYLVQLVASSLLKSIRLLLGRWDIWH